MNWHEYQLNMLGCVAQKSKDTSTKVGAIIVDHKNRTLSTGFNGFPIGVNDNILEVPERFERPAKYKYTEHAERNAIYTAAGHGIPLEGGTIYIDWYPCTDCARGIVQVGLKNVIVDGRDYKNKKKKWDDRGWEEDLSISVGEILFEAEPRVWVWGKVDKELIEVFKYE